MDCSVDGFPSMLSVWMLPPWIAPRRCCQHKSFQGALLARDAASVDVARMNYLLAMLPAFIVAVWMSCRRCCHRCGCLAGDAAVATMVLQRLSGISIPPVCLGVATRALLRWSGPSSPAECHSIGVLGSENLAHRRLQSVTTSALQRCFCDDGFATMALQWWSGPLMPSELHSNVMQSGRRLVQYVASGPPGAALLRLGSQRRVQRRLTSQGRDELVWLRWLQLARRARARRARTFREPTHQWAQQWKVRRALDMVSNVVAW